MFDINRGTDPQYLSELVRRCDDTWLWSTCATTSSFHVLCSM